MPAGGAVAGAAPRAGLWRAAGRAPREEAAGRALREAAEAAPERRAAEVVPLAWVAGPLAAAAAAVGRGPGEVAWQP